MSLERLAQGADPDREIPAPKIGAHRGKQPHHPRYDPREFVHFWRSRPGQGGRSARPRR